MELADRDRLKTRVRPYGRPVDKIQTAGLPPGTNPAERR